MKTTVKREITVQRTPVFHQLCGKFDLASKGTSSNRVGVDGQLPGEWSIGVIVGPSMAGKSTLANELFPGELVNQGDWEWAKDQCIGDGFPAGEHRRHHRLPVERGLQQPAGLAQAVRRAIQRRPVPRGLTLSASLALLAST